MRFCNRLTTCNANSHANNHAMPALPLSPEQRADAARLKAIYIAKKRELHLTQESLAAACGWESQGTVSQYLNGRIPLNVDAAVKFARHLGVSVSDFSESIANNLYALRDADHTTAKNAVSVLLSDSRSGQPVPAESNAETAPKLGAMIRVPVVGSAQLGDNGYWAELEYPVGHGDGYVEWPARDQDAYALRCIGESMRPRIKPGEFAIIYPNHPPTSGDEVLVKATDGRVMIKELAYVRDGVMTLLSVNEAHGKVNIPLDNVEKCQFVAGIAKKVQWIP